MLGRSGQRDDMELVVLSLLAESPRYGYAVSKELGVRSEGRVRLTPGVLYPLLKELESAGLIQGTWEEVRADEEGDGEGRKRKWYRVTAKGRKRTRATAGQVTTDRRIPASCHPKPSSRTCR